MCRNPWFAQKSTKRQPALVAAVFAFAVLIASGPAGAAGRFNQFIGLGDSTLDTGYFRYTTTGIESLDTIVANAITMGAKGGFAGPGVMATTLLADRFGLTAASVSDGGTNYANGASYTAPLRAAADTPYAPGTAARKCGRPETNFELPRLGQRRRQSPGPLSHQQWQQ